MVEYLLTELFCNVSSASLIIFSVSGNIFSSFIIVLGACSLVSIIPIKLPSETLSPTLTLSSDTLPEKGLGISTLDLSLSIVIIGSFLLTSSPSLIKISII